MRFEIFDYEELNAEKDANGLSLLILRGFIALGGGEMTWAAQHVVLGRM